MLDSKSMRPRPIVISLALLLATVISGLVIRFAPLGLPPFVVKYGGSTLWAMTIYWIFSALLPRRRLVTTALFTGAAATAVEFLKLNNPPALDAFRRTLPGVLLLGRFFSVWDIVAYLVGHIRCSSSGWQDSHASSPTESRRLEAMTVGATDSLHC